MEAMVSKSQELVLLYGLKAIAALLILIFGRLAAIGIRTLVSRVLTRSHIDATLVAFATNVSYMALMVFVIITALGQLGVQTASFIAVIGAAGLAIGLALQGSLTNFAAGVLMIIFKPFKVGDYIEAAGTAGVVEEIGILMTELRSPDNKNVVVPNAKAMGDNIINYSAQATRRINLVISVSYSDDLDKVRKVLESILSDDARILQDPTPTIGVLELGDNGVNIAVRPWVKTADYWPVFFATQETIKKRFDAEGITIPFPQQDVHVH